MIKIGDTVRFLNAVGGGTVVRVDEKQNLVFVADEDGFEIPALARECVVVGPVNETTNFPRKTAGAPVSVHPTGEQATPPANATKESRTELPVVETPDGDRLRAFLAFFPKDIKRLSDTDYTCMLVNDSNYYLFYNLVTGVDTDRRSIAHGIIEPNMQDVLTYIDKSRLNDWERVRVQITPFKKDKTYREQQVMDFSLKINIVKFYKLHSFVPTDYFEHPCMLFDLVQLSEKKRLTDISPDALRKAMLEKRPSPPAGAKAPGKTAAPQNGIIEIDLHINTLLDTTAGMTPADMLAYQLEVFRNTLNEYKGRKGQKIVFIHGKGEGVLRKAIEDELKSHYKSCDFQDASFREYGFGATMVTVR